MNTDCVLGSPSNSGELPDSGAGGRDAEGICGAMAYQGGIRKHQVKPGQPRRIVLRAPQSQVGHLHAEGGI